MEDQIKILGNISIKPLLKAQKSLVDAVRQASSDLEKDGAIQRFEFTYELCWKTLKKILAHKGISAQSPRDVFRDAATQGIIDDPVVWFEFMRKRNLTVHTYDDECAQEIFASLPAFVRELEKVVNLIKQM